MRKKGGIAGLSGSADESSRQSATAVILGSGIRIGDALPFDRLPAADSNRLSIRGPATLDVAESQPCGENANPVGAFRFQNATIGSPPQKSVLSVTRVTQACSTDRVFDVASVARGLHPINPVGPTPLSPRPGDAIHAIDWLDNGNPHRHALDSQRSSASGRQRPSPTRLGLETNTGRVGTFFSSIAETDRSPLAASLGGGQSRNPAGDFRPNGLPGDHSASSTSSAGIGKHPQLQAKTPPPRADSPSLIPATHCRNGSPTTRLIFSQVRGSKHHPNTVRHDRHQGGFQSVFFGVFRDWGPLHVPLVVCGTDSVASDRAGCRSAYRRHLGRGIAPERIRGPRMRCMRSA